LLHMPPVAELPKKPQPAAQRVDAEVSGARFDSMCGRIFFHSIVPFCDRLRRACVSNGQFRCFIPFTPMRLTSRTAVRPSQPSGGRRKTDVYMWERRSRTKECHHGTKKPNVTLGVECLIKGL